MVRIPSIYLSPGNRVPEPKQVVPGVTIPTREKANPACEVNISAEALAKNAAMLRGKNNE